MCWKVSMPEMPKVEMTARELVPQTESKAPDSPMFGDKDSFLNSAKKRGIQSLKINKNEPTSFAEKKWYGY